MNAIPKYRAGDMIAGRYKVRNVLLGGMGEVYVCNDSANGDHPVVLKTYQGDVFSDEQLRRRFLTECQAWMKLSPSDEYYVAKLLKVEIIENKPYQLMPYYDGGSLCDYICSKAKSYEITLKYAAEILLGMDFIHKENIVHRDLKPSNILISKDNVKVSDFGIVKAVYMKDEASSKNPNTTMTSAGTAVGTLPYMSPEQIRDSSKVDSRTDIWSYGVILYEMLAGQMLFSGTSRDELMLNIVDENITSKITRLDCSKKLKHVILKCLERGQQNRYQTVKEVLCDFDSLIQVDGSKRSIFNLFSAPQTYINDESFAHYWNDHFDRIPGKYKYTMKLAGVRIDDIYNYEKLGKLDDAIMACDHILGHDINTVESNYSCLLRGDYSDNGETVVLPIDKSNKGYAYVRPPKDFVIVAIERKMKILVDIIERKTALGDPSYKNDVEVIVKMANKIVSSKLQNREIHNYCAQAYILIEQYDKAESILRQLIYEDKTELKNWSILCNVYFRQGKVEQIQNETKELLENNWDKDDYKTQKICGLISLYSNNWRNAIHFFSNCVKMDAYDNGSYYYLSICFAQLHDTVNMKQCYNEMIKIDPNHPETLKVKYFIDAEENTLSNEQVIRRCRELACNGVLDSQYELGVHYLTGDIVAKDISEGLKWIELAAKQSHQKAMSLLEEMKNK